MTSAITARPVERKDLPALVAIENQVWGELDAQALGYEELLAWYEERSPLFLLAEDVDGPCAYTFSRQIQFSLDEAGAARFLDPTKKTGKGVSTHEADSNGNALYGISIASIRKGAGRALSPLRHRILEELKMEYFISFSRLSGLDVCASNVENQFGALPCTNDRFALWYALENSRLLSMRTWKECPEKPALALPPLTEVDPIMGFHARLTRYGVLGIQAGFLTDAPSRDYGVALLSRYPHQ